MILTSRHHPQDLRGAAPSTMTVMTTRDLGLIVVRRLSLAHRTVAATATILLLHRTFSLVSRTWYVYPRLVAGQWLNDTQNIIQNAMPDQLMQNPHYRRLQTDYEMLQFTINQMPANPASAPVPAPTHSRSSLPAATINTLLQGLNMSLLDPLTAAKYPGTKHWQQSTKDDSNDLVFGNSGTSAKPKKLGFLEDEDGNPLSEAEIKRMRATFHSLCQTLLDNGLAPASATLMNSEVRKFVRVSMYTAHPVLCLCDDHYKVDKLMIVVYGDWVKVGDRRAKIAEQGSSKKRKRDETQDKKSEKKKGTGSSKRQRVEKKELNTLIPFSDADDDNTSHDVEMDPPPPPPIPSRAPSPEPLRATSPNLPPSDPEPTRAPVPAVPPRPKPTGAVAVKLGLDFPLRSVFPAFFFVLVPALIAAFSENSFISAPKSVPVPVPTPAPAPSSQSNTNSQKLLPASSSTPVDGSVAGPSNALPAPTPAPAPAPAPANMTTTAPPKPCGRQSATGNSTVHKPGKPDTPYNLWGRVFMARPENTSKTSVEVQAIWKALGNGQKPYREEAKRLKSAATNPTATATTSAGTATTTPLARFVCVCVYDVRDRLAFAPRPPRPQTPSSPLPSLRPPTLPSASSYSRSSQRKLLVAALANIICLPIRSIGQRRREESLRAIRNGQGGPRDKALATESKQPLRVDKNTRRRGTEVRRRQRTIAGGSGSQRTRAEIAFQIGRSQTLVSVGRGWTPLATAQRLRAVESVTARRDFSLGASAMERSDKELNSFRECERPQHRVFANSNPKGAANIIAEGNGALEGPGKVVDDGKAIFKPEKGR
uniref:HMG box domain-containing protein n=1 Tax=Mycena chlorophos TaxID=658473 RepID=A0ABQ0LPJ5_MYCCL|nr:predicted protein [Mycena chlorophos]